MSNSTKHKKISKRRHSRNSTSKSHTYTENSSSLSSKTKSSTKTISKTNFKLKRIVSNTNTKNLDKSLQNACGIVIDQDSTIWTTVNKTGLLCAYDFYGVKSCSVGIPLGLKCASSDAAPTGLIINESNGFVISKTIAKITHSAASSFIFVTENGTIHGYNNLIDQNNAIMTVDNSDKKCFYSGIAQVNDTIYVADFCNKSIDVFDYNFVQLTGCTFIDPSINDPLPDDYAPYNIVYINNYLYVLYAKQSQHKKCAVIGKGFGFINVFTPAGIFVKRLVTNNELNAPWGIIKSPFSIEKHNDVLIVGNNGNGELNAYDFNGNHLTTLKSNYHKLKINGLWGLTNHKNIIFFAAGPNDNKDGLVGFTKNY
jgi:uncharacterized protein (TIGR03118 family)